jgi:hypothetical protein
MNTLQRFNVLCRAEVNGNTLHGVASVFDQVADTSEGPEMFARSAYDAVLADPNQDSVSLFNHNPDYLLGRQSAGTLTLRSSGEGLVFDVDLPDTQWGHDVRVLAQRGDLGGASVGFIPGQSQLESVNGVRVRMHTAVARLRDVSPVTFPAYSGTNGSLSMRSADQLVRSTRGRSQLIRARARVTLGRGAK